MTCIHPDRSTDQVLRRADVLAFLVDINTTAPVLVPYSRFEPKRKGYLLILFQYHWDFYNNFHWLQKIDPVWRALKMFVCSLYIIGCLFYFDRITASNLALVCPSDSGPKTVLI